MNEPIKCKNCQKVMTQQGEIWVCEDCGPAEIVAAPAPVVDAGAAQAVVNDAVSAPTPNVPAQ